MSIQNEIEALNALVELNEKYQESNFASMGRFFDHLFAVYASNFKKELRPNQIESSYSGTHLSKNYEIGDFFRMIESFKNNQILHAKYAIQILKDASNVLRNYPNITYLNLRNNEKVIIVGDLHGSFKDLYYIISKYGVPGSNYYFLFNGDFVDRGPQQSEVLLTILYSFLLNPGKVFINRGNHEDFSLNIDPNFDSNFKKDTEKKFGIYNLAVFNDCQNLFKCLPLACIVENRTGVRYFVTHGGVSDRTDIYYINGPNFNRFVNVIMTDTSSFDKQTEQIFELLWNDPTNSHYGYKLNITRGLGYEFGPDISKNFCSRFKFNGIIRSHQVCPNGFKQDHAFCFTVFSSSRYCGGSNLGAVIIIEANNSNFLYMSFDIASLNIDYHLNQKKKLISGLKSYLLREQNQLYPKFQKYDKYRNGHIDTNIWAEIIADHIYHNIGVRIDKKHIIHLKDNLCPCYDAYNTVEYAAMFKNSKAYLSNELNEFIKILFNLIDANGSGVINNLEAENAVKLVNKTFGTSYNASFITSMDLNYDGKVDFNEFFRSFISSQ